MHNISLYIYYNVYKLIYTYIKQYIYRCMVKVKQTAAIQSMYIWIPHSGVPQRLHDLDSATHACAATWSPAAEDAWEIKCARGHGPTCMLLWLH